MNRHLYIALFVAMCSSLGYSQMNEATKLPPVMPVSPKSYQFFKFSEIPVGKYTGITANSIPIYDLQAKGLSIPISISYSSNGFRVEEEAGSTGLGWNLNAGGSIVQTVNGFDDFDPVFNNRTLPNLAELIDIQCNTSGTCYATGQSIVNNGDIFLLGNDEGLNNLTYYNQGYTHYYYIPQNFSDGTKDYEPDVFMYNMMGYSGKFVLDWANNKFVSLGDNKVKITFNSPILNAAPLEFFITVPEGHVFTFTLKEETVVNNSFTQKEFWPSQPGGISIAGKRTSRSYQLTQIVTNEADEVNIEYLTTAPIKNIPSVSKSVVRYVDIPGSQGFPIDLSDNMTSYQYTQQPYTYVSRIIFRNGLLDFTYSDRIDLVGAKKLDKIELKRASLQGAIKTYNFGYDYFNGHSSGTNTDVYLSSPLSIVKTADELTKRLKLVSFQEVGHNPYLFEYEAEQLPKKTSLAKDYWGIYNGYLTNDSPFVDINKFNLERDNVTLLPYQNNFNYSSLQHAKAAVLKKITYPTGGSSEFIYELNSFDNYRIPSATQGAQKGVSISTIPGTAQGSQEVVMIEGGNTIFKGSALLSTRGCTNPEAYSSCYVKVDIFKKELIDIVKNTANYNQYGLEYVMGVLGLLNGSNPTLYNQYIVSSTKLQKLYNDPLEVIHSNLTYNVGEGIVVFSVSGGCGTYNGTVNSSQATLTLTYKDYKPIAETQFFGAGIRIKTINTYSKPNILALKKQYTYYGGKLMSPFTFFTSHYLKSYSYVNYEAGPTGTRKTAKGHRKTLNSNNFVASSLSADGKYVGYDYVDEYIEKVGASPSVTNGKIRDYYTNHGLNDGLPLSEIPQAVTPGIYTELSLPAVQKHADNGLVAKTQTFNNTNVMLTEKINNYAFLKKRSFFGMKQVLSEIYYVTAGNAMNDNKLYTVGVYPLNETTTLLTKTTEHEYSSTGTITRVNDFVYNNYGQVINDKLTISPQEIEEINYFYPAELGADAMAIQMFQSNLLSPVLEKEVVRNGERISKEKFIYFKRLGSNNNLARPDIYNVSKFKSSKGLNELEERISFNLYDTSGNVIEFSEDGAVTSYIWGYNGMLPIAKLENVKYDDIPYSILQHFPTLTQYTSGSYSENLLIDRQNELRSEIPQGLITTYTHIPLTGVSTIIDAKGDRTIYSYDSLGRLKTVKDKDNNILSENDYHYRP